MVSGKHKKMPLFKKLQLLRSLSNSSHPRSGSTSFISDASNEEQGFMDKDKQINSLIFPYLEVRVEAKESSDEEGFVIKVASERSCSGLLVFILEAFEDLGLDVLQARVSCSHNFRLHALAIFTDNEHQINSGHKEARRVEQGIFKAIQSWSEVTQMEKQFSSDI